MASLTESGAGNRPTLSRVLVGDALTTLQTLPDGIADMCVTSPPYWKLRDYGVEGQLGLEDTPEEYVENLVSVFREVRRVLCDQGTLWLNIGDCYAGSSQLGHLGKSSASTRGGALKLDSQRFQIKRPMPHGLKRGDLVGIPWRLAFALQADGWYLRSDIIWHKTNAMPSSVKSRPTTAHEYVFLLTKSRDYYYDAEAVKEPLSENSDVAYRARLRANRKYDAKAAYQSNFPKSFDLTGRNRRSVWSIATKPYPGAHNAPFPPKLVEPCILAGSPPNGTVLDPFGGSGTTGEVAAALGRNALLIELSPESVAQCEQRMGLAG